MHESSLRKMGLFRDKYLAAKKRHELVILDVGSQNVNGCYKPLFGEPQWRYIGLDMEPGNNVDLVVRDAYHWKELPGRSVDVVISGQALEHIEYFWVTMLEIYRVLRPGGICCLIAPAGGHEHRYPVDCWRFYPDGFAALARYAQLDVLEVYTQWQSQGYPDGSDHWMDSVLVCQKPQLGCRDGAAGTVRNRIQHLTFRLSHPHRARASKAVRTGPVRNPATETSTAEDGRVLLCVAGDDEAVISINGSAALVWSMCDGQRTVAEIAEGLARDFGMPVEVIRADVQSAIDDFMRAGLVSLTRLTG